MPESSGNKVPALSPKEWNTGRTLRMMSCALNAKRAASCARLASRFTCDSATPLGAPSEPEVNSTTASSSGTHRARTMTIRTLRRARGEPAAQLVHRAERVAHILQIHDTHLVPQPRNRRVQSCGLHETPRGVYGAYVRRGDRGQHAVRAHGVIQHRRHARVGVQR